MQSEERKKEIGLRVVQDTILVDSSDIMPVHYESVKRGSDGHEIRTPFDPLVYRSVFLSSTHGLDNYLKNLLTLNEPTDAPTQK